MTENYKIMEHVSFLATYQTYLYSGFFCERKDPKSGIGPVFDESSLAKVDSYKDSIVHEFKDLHIQFVDELRLRRLNTLRHDEMIRML